MAKYEALAKQIVQNVGGKGNVIDLTHCITRLRFKLKDESIANDDVLKQMNGVVTVMKSGGQYQVVIGNHVGAVYDDVCKVLGFKDGEEMTSSEAKGEKTNLLNKLIAIISGCFQPILGILTAAGMIKGLTALLTSLKILDKSGGTYIILNTIGDGFFYFMPIFLGYTSAKKFKLNNFTGMAIGAILCYPTIQAATLKTGEALGVLFQGTLFESNYYLKFLGVPIIANNYTSSVVPVILVVAFAAFIEKNVKKVLPEMLHSFFVPFFVLLITLPIGFFVIGPVITILINLLGTLFATLYDFSSVLMCLTVGFFWQCLVIFGLHWALIPLSIINIQNMGFDTALVGMFGTTFAQTAVVIAMYFKFKNKKMKTMCIPAAISGLCGITEPCIYGITLPRKKPFIFSLIGAACGGAIMGLAGVRKYTSGGLGIFGVVNYINTNTGDKSGMWFAFMSIVVSMLVSFMLTFLFWKDEESQKEITPSEIDLIAPVEGKIIPLDKVEDEAFACGAMGKGIAIEPSEGKVSAPFDGTIVTLFPTKHAIGIISDTGCEVLIHIGFNTVQLNGRHFTSHVKQGDKVKKGQLLIEFDMKAIKEEGCSLTTPVIITNTNNFKDIVDVSQETISNNEILLKALI